jgi:ribose-phosphate pyrophosphokinase
MNGKMMLFTGNANPELAKKICKFLKLPLSDALVTIFSEGEIRVKINEDVRGRDVFVVQPTCPPTNNNLMELLIMIDALKRASARRVTAVIPYFGYARQDRKDQPRVPITAKLVANLLTTAGADRVLTMDLHASQIQGFFDIPLDHLFAVKVVVDYFKKMKLKNLVVASPDVGGIKMARAYAKRLGAGLAIVDKRRIDDQHAEVMNILGEVKNKNIVIVDDLVATASSMCEASVALKKAGALRVFAAVSHPVLSGPAIERIKASAIEQFVVTDSIPLDPKKRDSVFKVLTVAPLLGEAIKRIHGEESVSSLFN